ncbi:MAG: hypothetical protein R3B36_36095 [Polyangiaceae bacterium]
MVQGQCYVDVAPGTNWRPVACPTPPIPLPSGACDRAEMCRGVSDEGCCIGCDHPMRTRLSVPCAKAVEQATSCAGVVKALARRDCAGR